MRRKLPPPGPPGEKPPLELLRCPWARWNDRHEDRFEEWLRSRQRWRETHAEPLPGLYARDRFALHRIEGLDPAVVQAEETAPRAALEWVQQSKRE
ncbi:MAG: hypothetical protein M3Q47_05375 [Actinomycetota bacterium]|nr:hypothetical protein [Actinomycetota bacterium]